MLKRLNTRGDTIIEVLIALAVLGSAFGISYATANKGLGAARNSEEHSQALQYIDKQTELLRSAATNTDAKTAGVFTMSGKAFCLTDTSPVTVVPFTSGWIPANQQPDTDMQNLAKYPAVCNANNVYYYSITYDNTSNNDTFHVLVRWAGLSNLGAQQESLSYKLHP